MTPDRERGSGGRFGRLLGKELRRARLSHWIGALPWVKLVQAAVAIVFALIVHLRPPRTPASGEGVAIIFWTLILIPIVLSLLWPWWRLPTARRLLREVEARREKSQVLETAADHAAGRLDGKGYSEEILDTVLTRAVDELAAGLPPAACPRRRACRPGKGVVSNPMAEASCCSAIVNVHVHYSVSRRALPEGPSSCLRGSAS